MGTRWSRSGSRLSLLPEGPSGLRYTERRDSDNDSLDGLVRREDIAQFPYVEFTGRDSITCPTCQGTGRIPSEQVNELVALIPYSDQRLQPQRTKLYVGLSVVLCLLASSLVVFFLFPRLVVVVDDGIRSVIVRFDRNNTKVLMNMTSTLNFSNPNFFSVHVQSINSQVLYMQTVIGTQQLYNVTTLLPLSELQRQHGDRQQRTIRLHLMHHAQHQGPQHSCSHANLSENLVHGANVPEQPGGLSLHRLRFQQHIPAYGPSGLLCCEGHRPWTTRSMLVYTSGWTNSSAANSSSREMPNIVFFSTLAKES